MIIGAIPTKENMIEKGMDLVVQCIKFDAEVGEVTTILTLNILGVIYSVSVPTHEMSEEKNLEDAWKQLIRDFGVCHLLGQSKRVIDGHRDATEGELKIMEDEKIITPK